MFGQVFIFQNPSALAYLLQTYSSYHVFSLSKCIQGDIKIMIFLIRR